MRRKVGLLVILGLVAAAAPLRDDGYTIKIKKSGQGDVTKQHIEETDKSSSRLEGSDGKALKETKVEATVTQEYKETILEKVKGKKPTKLRREYTKAVIKSGDKETPLPYQGKTVVIEKKEDGKYHFTIEGDKELTGKDAELLDRSFNKGGNSDEDAMEKIILPKKPVKEGDTWTIDAADIAKAFEKEAVQSVSVDKEKATGKGKLLRAYKEGDRQYGDLEIQLDVPLKGDFPLSPGQSAPIQPGSKITTKVRLNKACIDGTASDYNAEVSSDTDLTATFKGFDGKECKLTINSKHKEKSKEEDLSKK